MGRLTLERYVDALGGRLEIHAVLYDADTTLTALSDRRPQEGDGALSNPMNRLRRGDARIHAGAEGRPQLVPGRRLTGAAGDDRIAADAVLAARALLPTAPAQARSA